MKVLAIDGIPVTDAKAALELHILPGDCKGGDPKKPDTCAVAKAIRRELGAADCRVHLSRIYIRQNKGNWSRYRTPLSMRNEIIAFDRGGSFEPGEYVLIPLQPSVQSRKNRKVRKAKKSVPQRGRRTKQHAVLNVRNGPAAG